MDQSSEKEPTIMEMMDNGMKLLEFINRAIDAKIKERANKSIFKITKEKRRANGKEFYYYIGKSKASDKIQSLKEFENSLSQLNKFLNVNEYS